MAMTRATTRAEETMGEEETTGAETMAEGVTFNP